MNERYANQNKNKAKQIVEANQGRNIGDAFIDENGEMSRSKVLVYVSSREITVGYRDKNQLTNYKITGEILEVPIIKTVLFKKRGVFEEENIDIYQKIIDESLPKKPSKLEWGKIKVLTNYFENLYFKDKSYGPFSYGYQIGNKTLFLKREPFPSGFHWRLGLNGLNDTSSYNNIDCLFEEKVSLTKFQEALKEIIDVFTKNKDKIKNQDDIVKIIVEPIIKKYCGE
jgi:hypothetical protein